MRQKRLIFTKKDTKEKSTSMTDKSKKNTPREDMSKNRTIDVSEKIPEKELNNQDQTEKNNNEENLEDESNIVDTKNLENLQNKTSELKEQLKSIENEKEKFREQFLIELKDYEEIEIQKNYEIKEASNQYNQILEKLKNLEKKLVIKYKIKTNKTKVEPKEEDIKKDINIITARIKTYKNIVQKNKVINKKMGKKIQNNENKASTLAEELEKLEVKIKVLNIEIKDLMAIKEKHNSRTCKETRDKLLNKIKVLTEVYNCETLRGQKMEEELNDKNNLNISRSVRVDKSEEDNLAKAINDNKRILPKIQALKFSSRGKLEADISKKNKTGRNVGKNKLNIFSRLTEQSGNNDRYILEANENIRNKSGIKDQKSSKLFNEHENFILKRLIPKDILINYEKKYNLLLKEKESVEEKYLKQKNEKKEENIKISEDINALNLKKSNEKKRKLIMEANKWNREIENKKREIKGLLLEIKKIDSKIEEKNKQRKIIENYFNKSNKSMSNNISKTME